MKQAGQASASSPCKISGVSSGAENGGAIVHDDPDRDALDDTGKSSLVPERVHERAVLEFTDDLRCNSAPDVHSAHSHDLERKIARGGSVDRDKEVERLCTAFIFFQPGCPGYRCSWVFPFHFIRKPFRLCAELTGIPKELIDAEKTGA